MTPTNALEIPLVPEPCSFPELSLTDGIASQLERFEAICAAYFGTEPSSSTEATQLQTMDTPSSGTELSLSTEATQPETIYTSSSGTESPSSPEAKKLEITDAPTSGTESSSSIEATQLETTDIPISGAESASSTEDTQLETIDTPSSGTELALSTEMLKAPEPLQTTNAASASGSSGIRATAAALRHPLQFLLDHIPSIQTNDPETVYKEIVTQLNRSCLECEASLRLQGRLWRTGKM
ncbi:hypothetical protein LOZ12_006139 [Ophidiomyces ophidiicola]|uniref:Uncharacterized protein n=1 Tax=Ophidiomyces ophidiicola TaxID=1387563 RepID=A0ACB8UY22_9EURO|nr:hypothetical protein LOZ62_006154 [Ophidiomyces ophidiicola]KAI1948566.1 hypothetical protein LOZ59_006338 [Ophidiomyces ophidiicola]KAI1967718.1 hypothetical protein LOZ56_005374 [Ophidiomyces ophidiicola]KAI2022077.1 hypothetical protein LOZ45_004484 [Ophidiomyces ophidiicola]KAI2032450.1 hypothetical protein LOZ47_005751 [Ophidiomyces ophidiicola]